MSSHLTVQVSVEKHQGARESQHSPWGRKENSESGASACETPVFGQNIPKITWGAEGFGVALMEAAGEVLQHALPLLSLSDQHHLFQERSGRKGWKQCFARMFSWSTPYALHEWFSPQGTVEGLRVEVKEFQVFFPDSTTEVITKRKQNSSVSL